MTAPDTASQSVLRIHVVGRKNSGKTTLICELLTELQCRGIRTASIKHTHHQHELDTPGKDSFRHREAGAVAVGILSPHMTAMFFPYERDAESSEDHEHRYAGLQAAFNGCDLILVEGDLKTTAMKIEVWRAESRHPPYAESDESISAIVTDDSCTAARIPLLPRSNPADLTDWILNRLNVSHRS